MMSRLPYRLLQACLLLLSGVLHAETELPSWTLSDWSNPAPALHNLGVTPEQLARVLNRDILVVPHAPRAVRVRSGEHWRDYPAARFVTAATVLPVTATRAREIMSDLTAYTQIFPLMTGAKVIQARAAHRVGEFAVMVPLPVMNVAARVWVKHTAEADGSLSVSMLRATAKGQLKLGAIPIPLASTETHPLIGRWEFHDVGEGNSLVAFTFWAEENSRNWMVRLMLKMQPDIKLVSPYVASLGAVESLRRHVSKTVPALQKEIPAVPDALRYPETIAIYEPLMRQGPLAIVHPEQSVWLDGKAQPWRYVTAMNIVRTDVETARDRTITFDRYREVFPQVRKVKLLNAPKGMAVDWRLGVDLGLLSIPLRLGISHEWEAYNRLGLRAWSGDVAHLRGEWRWYSPPGTRQKESTLLSMTSAHRLDDRAPWLLRVGSRLPYADMMGTMVVELVAVQHLPAWIEKSVSLSLAPNAER